jgi:hypothetical protein
MDLTGDWAPRHAGGLEIVGLWTSTPLSTAPRLWLADWFSEAPTHRRGSTCHQAVSRPRSRRRRERLWV